MVGMSDLLARTAALVDVPSVSHQETQLADLVESELRAIDHLRVERLGDNVVARTEFGHPLRLVLAGHLDTVPPNGNAEARVVDDALWGLGSADMKAGLAVMLELAITVPQPVIDVTWIFYSGEEVDSVHNGLGHLFRDRPDLVVGDAALLCEPTDGDIEAGCQGTMRLRVSLAGVRAHTARPWLGRNALHRAGQLLVAVDRFQARRPLIDGCEFREALQAVKVEGGVAGNVVPDRAVVTLNHRFAPDRSPDDARAEVDRVLAPVLSEGDQVEVVDVAPAAPPALTHPLLAALRDRSGLDVRAKLGWTDVARFAAAGIPAANLGPGDPQLAHRADEHVRRESIERVYRVVEDLLRHGGGC